MTEDITDSSFDCAGSLAYLFSQRPLSRNEQHEPHCMDYPHRDSSQLLMMRGRAELAASLAQLPQMQKQKYPGSSF